MKEVSSKRMNLKIQMYFDIFLNVRKLDDERNNIACISDAKVNDDIRYSGASPLIVLNI